MKHQLLGLCAAAMTATAQDGYVFHPSTANQAATRVGDGWMYGSTNGRTGAEHLLTGEAVELDDRIDYHMANVTGVGMAEDGTRLVVGATTNTYHSAIPLLWRVQGAEVWTVWLPYANYDLAVARGVGDSYIAGTGTYQLDHQEAVVWSLSDLSNYSLHDPGWVHSFATNAEGSYVSGVFLEQGATDYVGVRWTGNNRESAVHLMPALGDWHSVAWSVNRFGVSVGYTAGPSGNRACWWDIDGNVRTIMDNAYAVDINNHGVMVGSYVAGGGGWVWDSMAFPPEPPRRLDVDGIDIGRVLDIDDAGNIVVWIEPWHHVDSITSGILKPKVAEVP